MVRGGSGVCPLCRASLADFDADAAVKSLNVAAIVDAMRAREAASAGGAARLAAAPASAVGAPSTAVGSGAPVAHATAPPSAAISAAVPSAPPAAPGPLRPLGEWVEPEAVACPVVASPVPEGPRWQCQLREVVTPSGVPLGACCVCVCVCVCVFVWGHVSMCPCVLAVDAFTLLRVAMHLFVSRGGRVWAFTEISPPPVCVLLLALARRRGRAVHGLHMAWLQRGLHPVHRGAGQEWVYGRQPIQAGTVQFLKKNVHPVLSHPTQFCVLGLGGVPP